MHNTIIRRSLAGAVFIFGLIFLLSFSISIIPGGEKVISGQIYLTGPSPTRPSHCVTLPPLPTDDQSPRTPTPDFRFTRDPASIPVYSTRTPRFPSPEIETDLSPGIERKMKAILKIFHCNGTVEWVWYDPRSVNVFTEYTFTFGDVIIGDESPAIMMERKLPPPEKMDFTNVFPTVPISVTRTVAYPPPAASSPTIPPTKDRNPYP